MLAASALLAIEGVLAAAGTDKAIEVVSSVSSLVSSVVPVLIGAAAGCGFILGSKQWLERHESLRFAGFSELSSSDYRKALLIIAVMTLHSAAEGIGLGVAFSHSTTGAVAVADGSSGAVTGAGTGAGAGPASAQVGELGVFLSAALALHNVPEGLAICLVLVPRGVSVLESALWAVFASITQPLLAVPAFLSVHAFASLLPFGLGFACGAMSWLALYELLVEAHEAIGRRQSYIVCVLAALLMLLLQEAVR